MGMLSYWPVVLMLLLSPVWADGCTKDRQMVCFSQTDYNDKDPARTDVDVQLPPAGGCIKNFRANPTYNAWDRYHARCCLKTALSAIRLPSDSDSKTVFKIPKNILVKGAELDKPDPKINSLCI